MSIEWEWGGESHVVVVHAVAPVVITVLDRGRICNGWFFVRELVDNTWGDKRIPVDTFGEPSWTIGDTLNGLRIVHFLGYNGNIFQFINMVQNQSPLICDTFRLFPITVFG